MSGIYKRTELAANIAIILVSMVLAVVLVQRYLFPSPSPTAAAPPKITAGTKISLPGDGWNKDGKTILVVLQKNCHFCAESAPFYQRLEKIAAEKNIKLIAVLPTSVEESQKYLQEIKVNVAEVKQAQLSSVDVRGTPTLILANGNGEVLESWVGKLPATQEEKVIASL